MTNRMTPFDQLVGPQSGHFAGDAIGQPEHPHLGAEPRTQLERRGPTNVVADGARTVDLMVAARVGNQREQLGRGSGDVD